MSSPLATKSTEVPSAPRKASKFARVYEKMEIECSEKDESMEWVAPAAPKKMPNFRLGLEMLDRISSKPHQQPPRPVEPSIVRGMQGIGRFPSKPRQHPPRPSTAHLEPSIVRGMQGIGGFPTRLTFSPECPWAPVRQTTAKTVSVENIRKLNL